MYSVAKIGYIVYSSSFLNNLTTKNLHRDFDFCLIGYDPSYVYRLQDLAGHVSRSTRVAHLNGSCKDTNTVAYVMEQVLLVYDTV